MFFSSGQVTSELVSVLELGQVFTENEKYVQRGAVPSFHFRPVQCLVLIGSDDAIIVSKCLLHQLLDFLIALFRWEAMTRSNKFLNISSGELLEIV